MVYLLNLFPTKVRSKAGSKMILIVEPFGMGDILQLEPLIRGLTDRGCQVIVIAQERWEKLIPVELWPVSLPWDRIFRQPGKFWGEVIRFRRQFSQRIRAQEIWGMDPRGDIRSILFLRLIGVNRVLALDHYAGTDLKLPKICEQIPDTSPLEQRWKVNVRLGEAILGAGSSRTASWPRVDAFADNPPPRPGQIGLIPVAPWAGKLWPEASWNQLIEELSESSEFSFRILCGPGQAVGARHAVGRADLPVDEARDVPALARAISQCELLISVDSGPMHLAASLERPVVGLFGCTQLPVWSPAGKWVRVVRSQALPVHQISANVEFGKKSMRQITVSEVKEAVLDLLKQVRDSSESDQMPLNG